MHTFFHGWRRQAGVVTLVMALALMSGWIRSLSVTDSCQLPVGGRWQAGCVSHRGRFSCGWTDLEGAMDYEWRTVPNHGPIALRIRGLYFDFTGGQAPNPSGKLSPHIIPYWCVVLPLTLLSAYLILWKPRKREAK